VLPASVIAAANDRDIGIWLDARRWRRRDAEIEVTQSRLVRQFAVYKKGGGFRYAQAPKAYRCADIPA
jgi:hypothetical protein